MNSKAPDPLAATVAEALDHHLAGRLDKALKLYEEVLDRQSNHADALHYRGVLAYQVGDNESAIELLRQALRVDPDRPAAWCDLGAALHADTEFEDARQALDKAIDADPGLVEAWLNLGLVHLDRGAPNEAIECLQQAVALDPTFAEAYHVLGTAQVANFEFGAGIAAFEKALMLRPDHAATHINLGNAYRDLREIGKAQSCYARALELDPESAEAHSNFGITLKDQGRLEETAAAFRRALELNPSLHEVRSNLLFCLCFDEDKDAGELFEEHLEFERQRCAEFTARIAPHKNEPDPDRVLRIGYVSPDFRVHPGGHYYLPIVEGLDRAFAEVTCYYTYNRYDELTRRFQNAADRWHDAVSWTDERLATQIRADEIDILVECAGHMAGNRLLALARKPAPVQVSFPLYPATTGLAAVDYRIMDEYIAPEGAENYLTEEIIRLPKTHVVYRPLDIDVEPASVPPFERNGYVTFGSFNNIIKVSPSTIGAWARILRELPSAKLVVKWIDLAEGDPGDCRAKFVAHGVAPDQIVLADWAPDPYSAYRDIDIALDPLFVNGGTTTCDAIWMGVPVVTRKGGLHTSRIGFGHLTNLGLTEFVAETTDEYVDIVVGLARDRDKLKSLHHELRERFRNSPLMDEAQYIRDLQDAFRTIWRRWCEGQED